MTADDIIRAARACLDTPFKHQGRIPGRSLDCAGLVVAVCQAVGVDCIDRAGYGHSPAGGLLESALDDQPNLYQVPYAELAAGDVLLMRFEGEPQHLAICAGETIIHSYAQVRRVCEHRLSSEWASRIVRTYRFRSLA